MACLILVWVAGGVGALRVKDLGLKFQGWA